MRGTIAWLLALVVFALPCASLRADEAEEIHLPHQKEGTVKDEPPSALDHVLDSYYWELFDSFGIHEVYLPDLFFGLPISKFMVLEVIAGLLVILIYVPISWRVRDGKPPRGAWTNAFESLLTFVREQIARPNFGHDTDHYVPFLWTLFLFILFNNLLGMVPLGGSPTASIFVTLGLAAVVFFFIHGSAIKEMGARHYLESYIPHIHVPFNLGYAIIPLIFFIEIVGVLVRNAVLAVRLFANMFAGHMVMATILIFIKTSGTLWLGLWGMISIVSVAGILALSLLEIFVAFLQAYIFTFLTALFMGMALHPQH